MFERKSCDMVACEDMVVCLKGLTCGTVGAVRLIPAMDNFSAGQNVMDELCGEVEEFWMGPAEGFEEGPVDSCGWIDLVFCMNIRSDI